MTGDAINERASRTVRRKFEDIRGRIRGRFLVLTTNACVISVWVVARKL